jgi:hypothetical protein
MHDRHYARVISNCFRHSLGIYASTLVHRHKGHLEAVDFLEVLTALKDNDVLDRRRHNVLVCRTQPFCRGLDCPVYALGAPRRENDFARVTGADEGSDMHARRLNGLFFLYAIPVP